MGYIVVLILTGYAKADLGKEITRSCKASTTLWLVKSGPKLVLGSFKRDFFNLTELSIYPRYKFASGQCLFIFNQVVDKEVIEFKIKQQL